ncbi:MAG: YncE family protein [Burkholderiaceae bacterium]|nr:YncE family protein [Burkholderiaceae bacterium]
MQFPIIVLNSRDADVSLIHPVSHAVVGRVPTGKEPHHLYPTPDNKHVVVGNAVSDSLTFLDPATGKVLMSIPGVDDPYHLGFSPDQSFFVTCANRLDHVDVYHRVGHGDQLRLKGVARFALTKTPSHLVFTEDSQVVFCTLQESDELVAIDLRRLVVLWRFKVGRLPAGVAISPDSKLLFVGCMGENSVQVIEPRLGTAAGPRLVAAVKTGEGAHAFRNHGNKRHLWVSNRMANTVSKLDMGTLKVESEIAVPGGPDCMDVHQSGKQLWVTQRWNRSVSLVDLDQSRVVKRITVGRSPHGVYLHDRAGLL